MRIYFLLIATSILLISFCGLSLCGEQLTITTYYPAPYGVYREFESRRMVIGDDSMPTQDGVINFQELDADPAFADAGTMYYNSAEGFKYYDGSSWNSVTSKCIRRTFTAATGSKECPVGYMIAQSSLTSGVINNVKTGIYLCCPYE